MPYIMQVYQYGTERSTNLGISSKNDAQFESGQLAAKIIILLH